MLLVWLHYTFIVPPQEEETPKKVEAEEIESVVYVNSNDDEVECHDPNCFVSLRTCRVWRPYNRWSVSASTCPHSLVLSNLRASSVWVGTQKEEEKEEEARMDKLRGKIDNDDALLSNPMLCTMLSFSPPSLGIITHMRRTKMRCDWVDLRQLSHGHHPVLVHLTEEPVVDIIIFFFFFDDSSSAHYIISSFF